MFVVPRSRIFASMSEVLWLLHDLPRKEKRKENKMVVKSSYCAITCSWKKKCIFISFVFIFYFFISNQQVKTVGVSEGRSMLPYLDGHTSNTACCLHDGQKRSTCLQGGQKMGNTLSNVLYMHLFVQHLKIHDFGFALLWIY